MKQIDTLIDPILSVIDVSDVTGFSGAILHFSLLLALVGSTLLVFLYLWKNKRLDMDEDPKYQMLRGDADDLSRKGE
ncbi:MAG: hypothetical protein CMO81_04980 [Waddliaceae bacterium]|nr:hypothetical protein [Waddliaceae bacterium]